jgi:NAD(P)-dependent dehydrogenase (short-subunit alcohol dehydrogenase family)
MPPLPGLGYGPAVGIDLGIDLNGKVALVTGAGTGIGRGTAGKSAVDMLTRVAALEAALAVRVNGIRPGSVLTPMHDEALALSGGATAETVGRSRGCAAGATRSRKRPARPSPGCAPSRRPTSPAR